MSAILTAVIAVVSGFFADILRDLRAEQTQRDAGRDQAIKDAQAGVAEIADEQNENSARVRDVRGVAGRLRNDE